MGVNAPRPFADHVYVLDIPVQDTRSGSDVSREIFASRPVHPSLNSARSSRRHPGAGAAGGVNSLARLSLSLASSGRRGRLALLAALPQREGLQRTSCWPSRARCVLIMSQ